MLGTIVITLLIVAISFCFLAIKILLKKHGRFSSTHVGGSKAMKKRGIGCIQSQDFEARTKNRCAVNERDKIKNNN
jgi:hypothetical protein